MSGSNDEPMAQDGPERRTLFEHRMLRVELRQERLEAVVNGLRDDLKFQADRIQTQLQSDSGTVERTRRQLEEIIKQAAQSLKDTIAELDAKLATRLTKTEETVDQHGLSLYGNGDPGKGLVVRTDRHAQILKTLLWVIGGAGAILGGFFLTRLLTNNFGGG